MKANITAASLLLAAAAIFSPLSQAGAAPAPLPQTGEQQNAQQPQWIEIGDVKLINERTDRYITGQLQVLYLGERLIYRVRYNNEYYPVTPSASEVYGCNAIAKIPAFDPKRNKTLMTDHWLKVPTW